MEHITVLKEEAITALTLKSGALVIDCTFGGGGHSRAILEALGPDGQLLAIDADESAFTASQITDKRFHSVTGNFRNVVAIVAQQGFGSADAILADLGWRTDQFTAGDKGFSFTDTKALSMAYGDSKDYVFTASDVVNEWDEESLADIIFHYGEERAARKVAKAIVTERSIAPIKTAAKLAEVVAEATKPFYRTSRIHAATKTFQAIRIAVNDELGALEQLLTDGFELLAPGGRMAIISFHSLEDRIVKNCFRNLKHDHRGTVVTKKPLTASAEELAENPRARSAKLRVIEKI